MFPCSLVESINLYFSEKLKEANMILVPVSEKVRVLCPGSSNRVIRTGKDIGGGIRKAIDRDALPEEDRARLEIIEATKGLEIINIIVTEDNRLSTIDVSTNTGAVGQALISIAQAGFERPATYFDGYVIQLNF